MKTPAQILEGVKPNLVVDIWNSNRARNIQNIGKLGDGHHEFYSRDKVLAMLEEAMRVPDGWQLVPIEYAAAYNAAVANSNVATQPILEK